MSSSRYWELVYWIWPQNILNLHLLVSTFLACSHQPSEIKPNNTNFILADVRNNLPFESNYFDYIHLECIRILKPGGWIEFQEIQHSMNNPVQKKFSTLALDWIPNITNINEISKQVPLGWGGKLVEEYEESFSVLKFYIAEPIAKIHNRPMEEINELINNMRLEMSEYKSSHVFIRNFGQRNILKIMK
ncbi:hypothetical protein Glove_21g369 [Diversispora epigaea]|uniref:Methyltransferase type 11 domain-containing protein n=1 Tax=Diversispora epigaea TaxID=1348612 RepID=A0A397JKA0_9GLOM|nr:hypothetical protein Glove_21g369 [Diversispora epigaea]